MCVQREWMKKVDRRVPVLGMVTETSDERHTDETDENSGETREVGGEWKVNDWKSIAGTNDCPWNELDS